MSEIMPQVDLEGSSETQSVVATVQKLKLNLSHLTVPNYTGENQDILSWFDEFEHITDAVGWNDNARLKKIGVFLTKTARNWYNYSNAKEIYTEYYALKEAMIKSLNTTDYRSSLYKKLTELKQRNDQSISSFIYEVVNLCRKIDAEMSDMTIITHIRDTMNPSLRPWLFLLDPSMDSIVEFEEKAKLAERSYIAQNEANIAHSKAEKMANDISFIKTTLEGLETQLKQKNKPIEKQERTQIQIIRCNYCLKLGHRIKDCRKKMRDEQQYRVRYDERPYNTNPPPIQRPPVYRVTYPPNRNLQQNNRMVNNTNQVNTYPKQNNGWNWPTNTQPKKDANKNGQNYGSNRQSEPSSYNPPQQANVLTKNNESSPGICMLNLNAMLEKRRNRLIHKTMSLNGKNFDVFVDPGSEVSLITEDVFDQLCSKRYPYYGSGTSSATNHAMKINGVCFLRTSLYSEGITVSTTWKFLITDTLPNNIRILAGIDLGETLGMTVNLRTKKIYLSQPEESIGKIFPFEDDIFTLNTMAIIEPVNTAHINPELNETQVNKLQETFKKYDDIFAKHKYDLGRAKGVKFTIDTGDAKPIASHPYQYSAGKRDIAKKMVQEMLDTGVIEESRSPWSSPILFVKKKDGDIRFVIDYRKINSITKKDNYPLLNIQAALDATQGAKYFSSLDLISGYWQVEIDPNDKEKSAFITQDGLYQFKVLSFGLTGAPACFQRMMDKVLAGIKYKCCLVYLDDIIIFSKTFDQHIRDLSLVFDRLREANLKMKPSKCYFCKDRILYLGHVISSKGQEPDPDKLQAIKTFPVPTTLKECRSFTALCSYYRRFVYDFAAIARPLCQLTKKNVQFEWNEDCQKAFETLKEKLMNPPILLQYQPDRETLVKTDASDYAIGAILAQKVNGKSLPIAYASRLLHGPELNYSTSDKECLAIVWAVEKFRQYLELIPFEIVTDHCALCYLKTKAKLPPRLTRYAILLSEFDYKVVYRSGKKHNDVDALSRNTCNEEKETDFQDRMFIATIQNTEYNMKQLQEKCEWCKSMKQKVTSQHLLTTRQKERIKRYAIKNDLLVRIVNHAYENKYVAVVPLSTREQIIKSYHDDAGHSGPLKTYDKIQTKYYWPRMAKQIANYIRTCNSCQLNKKGNAIKETPIQPIISTSAFKTIEIDVIGPLPASRGKKYIIVAIDLFTKWCETKAVSNHNAKTTAIFIVENILQRHGCPKKIISDQGTNFTSNLIKQINVFMNSKWSFATPYHPQTSGQVERTNRSLIQILQHYCNMANKTHWDLALPLVTFCYNITGNKSTKASPFFLLYGRMPDLPIDITLSDEVIKQEQNEYMEFINRQWPEIRNLTNLYNKQSKQQLIETQKRTTYPTFKKGDKILIEKKIRNKLQPTWKGPFRITKLVGPVTFEVARVGSHSDRRQVHASQIKHYFSEDKKMITPNEIYQTSSDQESEDENKNVNVIVNRQQTPRIRNLFNPFTMMFSLLALAFALEPAPLMQWIETDKTVIKGQAQIRNKIFIISPCQENIMEKLKGSSQNQSTRKKRQYNDGLRRAYGGYGYSFPKPIPQASEQQVKEIEKAIDIKPKGANATANRKVFNSTKFCEDLFSKNILKPITEVCELRPMRRKRAFVTLFVAGVAFVAGGSLVKLYDYMFDDGSDDTIEKLKPILQTNQNISELMKKELDHVQQQLKNATSFVNELVNKTAETGKVAQITSLIAAEFVSRMTDFERIIRIWKRKRDEYHKLEITHEILYLFNITLPCFPNCRTRSISKVSCKYEYESPIIEIQLTYRIDLIHSEMRIMEAKPFETETRNDTRLCKRKYIGPRYQIYNGNNSLLCKYKHSYLKDISEQPTEEECEEYTKSLQTKKIESDWEEDCRITDEQPMTIVEYSNDNIFIYCYNMNFSHSGINMSCPPFVFKVPDGIDFFIGNQKYERSKIYLESNVNFKSDYARRLTMLMPNMWPVKYLAYEKPEASEHITKLLQITKQWVSDESLDSYKSFKKLSFFQKILVLVGIICLCLIVVALVKYYFRYNLNFRYHRQRKEQPHIIMSLTKTNQKKKSKRHNNRISSYY